MAQIELKSLSRHFGSLRALDELELSIEAGEWVAVTGPSGSGKTTLLNILAGLDMPSSGSAKVGDCDLATLAASARARYRREQVGLVFQRFHLIPYLTALENVMLAQYVHSMTDRAEAEEALSRVGLAERLDHLPRELSGGEQQRVCIARALINHPPILLADEPTGNLDAVNEALVMALMADLHRRGHTLVLVTHDPAIAARADREVTLEHGRRVELRELASDERSALLADLWRRLEEESRPVSVERAGVAELLAEGLLTFSQGRLALTPEGRSEAASAVRRFRLAEVLVARTLESGRAQDPAKVIPIAPEAVEQVEAFLDFPSECPHGRPIPAAPRRGRQDPRDRAASVSSAAGS